MKDEQQKNKGFIPLHGGYKNLITYQKSEIIYDGTIYFTKRFFQKYDRTIDQMVQAARSGKQNIVEASMASGTSKEMEIKLTNVARASLEELKIDYQILRKSVLVLRAVNHKLRQEMIRLIDKEGKMTVTDLYVKLRLEQSVASQHLALLRRAGVVVTSRDGKYIYYAVDHQRMDEINRLLNELIK